MAEELVELERRLGDRERRGQIRVDVRRNAERLVQAKLGDLRVVVRRERVHLRLSERDFGRANVDDRSRANLELGVDEIELALRRLQRASRAPLPVLRSARR